MRAILLVVICVALGACAAVPTTGGGGSYVSRGLESRKSQEVGRQTIVSEEEMAPYADMMVYPADWEEISRKRQ